MSINIVKYISELLYRHDCVIIPGFGGFIGNYSPAIINPVYHTFYPPFKSLLFNIRLKQNDGLLASHISQAEHISYDQAMELISQMLKEWNQELENGQVIIVENVGKLLKENNDIIQFEQDHAKNYLSDSYGLTSLVSPAIHRPGMQDKLEKKLNRYINSPSGRSVKLTRSLRWAAVLALPLGLAAFLSISNMDQLKSFHENYTGFLFSNSAPLAKKTIKPMRVFSSLKRKDDPVQPINKVQSTIMLPEKQDSKPVLRASSDSFMKNNYAIIVGAFRFRENADKLIAKLNQEGYNAVIYDTTRTGLFRVSIGSYISRDEAIGQLAMVRSKNYTTAWLLSK
jgi:cell division septation protein DedD